VDVFRSFLLNPATVWVLIPVAAILIGGIGAIMKQTQRHKERMAMIERGMDPNRDSAQDGG
jgi:hypothetical protein